MKDSMNEKLPPVFGSDPEELRRIQSTARAEQTIGIYNNETRKEFAEEFASWAVEHLQEMHERTIMREDGTFDTSGHMLQFSVLEKSSQEIEKTPLSKDSPLWGLIHDTIKLHLAAYTQALASDPSDALQDSIFDLTSSRENIEELRLGYLQELFKNVVEHEKVTKGGSWDSAARLATYYAPEWLQSFIDGSKIQLFFEGQVGYDGESLNQEERQNDATSYVKQPLPEQIVSDFLAAYTPNYRMFSAVNNIKKPLEAVARIYDNYHNRLSNDSISKHLETAGASEQDITTFLAAYTPSDRIYSAVHNIEQSLEAVKGIFFGTRNVSRSRTYNRTTGKFQSKFLVTDP